MVSYTPVIESLNLVYPYKADVLRLDLIHPEVSGNKWFKLRHNFSTAIEQGHDTIITFGGAYSNHIAATAALAKQVGIKAIGIIRGEEKSRSNPTLIAAENNGMQLHFVNREDYRKKNDPQFLHLLEEKFGSHYLVPEGGNNAEGVSGCTEILNGCGDYDYVFCACGTGATYAGLLASATNAKIIGMSVLKGSNLLPVSAAQQAFEITGINMPVGGNECLNDVLITQNLITNSYSFSGYASFDAELMTFKQRFEKQHHIPLDYIYTTKLFYGVCDLMQKQKLKSGSKTLIIHSGGLQGNAGFEQRYMPSQNA